MEEEQVNIKKIITTIDNDKSYSIDVDETTTFSEFKKILAGAAHLLKNCFRIYYGEKSILGISMMIQFKICSLI